MNAVFSESFLKSLRKRAALKKSVKKKVDAIIKHPIALGEPLKGIFRGYYSCPVSRNFLVVFLYCRVCRLKKDDEVVLCHDCKDCPDDTIKFIALGPHDQSYNR